MIGVPATVGPDVALLYLTCAFDMKAGKGFCFCFFLTTLVRYKRGGGTLMLTDTTSSDRRICADPLRDENKRRKIISIFIRNDPVSIQAVRLAFDVPCVENQNQSVHPSVPSKGSICQGLISNSAVQLIFTNMYIQISLQTPGIHTKTKQH